MASQALATGNFNFQEPFSRSSRTMARASVAKIAGNKNVVVVGAGPAGCLMAIYLARRGFHVHLFERRLPVLNENAPEQAYVAGDSRSYTMLLTSRAVRAFEGADVSIPASLLGPLRGGCMHLQNGGTRVFEYSSDPGLRSYGISRTSLVTFLQGTLRKGYPDRVTSHFGWELVSIDDQNCVAEFRAAKYLDQSTKEDRITAEYDLLIGSDGVSSKTRTLLLELGGGNHQHDEDSPLAMSFTQNPEFYKSFYVRPSLAKASQFHQHHNYVQSWPALNVLLVGMADGSFWGGSKNPELMKASNASQVEEIFRQKAPDLYELLSQENPNFAEDYSKQPAISFGGAVILSRFHHRNVVLIGDAAHAMFPSYGTGCNVALEDCWLLDQIIGEYQASSEATINFSQVAKEFTHRRLADAHAIVHMNSSLELLPRGYLGMAQMLLFTRLQKLFPSFVKPTAYQLLWSHVPFREIQQRKRAENISFFTFLAVVAACAVAVLLKLLA